MAILSCKRGWKIFFSILSVIILLACAGAASLYFGIGIPPAKTVVEDFYSNPLGNKSMLSDTLSDQQKDVLVNSSKDNHGITIDGFNPDIKSYTVYITVKNYQNKDIHYKIGLERDNFISWKINEISLDFASVS